MAETKIEWTDHSINPIRARDPQTNAVGHYCEKVSAGCAHCYASRMQKRFKMPEFGSGQKRDDVRVFLDDAKLEEVLRRKKPTRYFWCVAGSTKVLKADGTSERIDNLKSGETLVGCRDGLAVSSVCRVVCQTRDSEIAKVRIGRNELLASEDHQVLTPFGYRPIRDLHVGDLVYNVVYGNTKSEEFQVSSKVGLERGGMRREDREGQPYGASLSCWNHRRGRYDKPSEDEGRLLSANNQHRQYGRGVDSVSPSIILAGGCSLSQCETGSLSQGRAQWLRNRSSIEKTGTILGGQATAMHPSATVYCLPSPTRVASITDRRDAGNCEGHQGLKFSWSKIDSIEATGTRETLWDLSTDTGNFVAEGLVVHNCDMTDLFGEWVPSYWIDRCFAVMALTPQHTHQVLTKRPECMAKHLLIDGRDFAVKLATSLFPIQFSERRRHMFRECQDNGREGEWWPLTNCWLGTSIENQQTADERIPHLLRCPASVRFLSCEPLLEPLVFPLPCRGSVFWGGISWAICGCESRGRRVGRLPGGTEEGYWAAAREIREQCEEAGVAFFHKQGPVGGKVSHDPAEWPEDMRRREFPGVAHA